MSERDEQFTRYVRGRREHLRRSALVLCGDPTTAEDLVQTTLTKLYLAWPRVATMTAPDAYARRVLVNAHVDLTRRPWWRRELSAGDDLPEHPAHPNVGVVEDRDELADALAALPPAMRRVIVLRYLWDLGIAETADLLGISPGTVKSQSSKGLAHLARALSPADLPPAHEAPDAQEVSR
ncbi:SigE family RNA polymerase sigma factor [Intrasporangium sp. YIM S08009]|uniref:SigE family RNA polymerase sigma factor n=1 Tax=Intrasporangium zincisolvens TaxID=3080018 RepID=UPI002B051EE0|nr:SigE family RNA polymerase sigma factor [Intrasporangium sp. YIM S08009]